MESIIRMIQNNLAHSFMKEACQQVHGVHNWSAENDIMKCWRGDFSLHCQGLCVTARPFLRHSSVTGCAAQLTLCYLHSLPLLHNSLCVYVSMKTIGQPH